ncbi:phospholipase effector Tle1 domain-containing protein [Aeromonas jandaei]|uniref:phospholipase effector Tle1 domain-containing protein n=1 Tax=Aeromonas jandaei TaxID=650 RepID=UPI003D1D1596
MPKNELSNLPTRVYRSDLRSPDEVFSNGMPISGTDDDIYRHVNGSSCKKGTSAFLATSDNLEFLKKHWAKDGLLMSKQDFIYIYEIIPDARFFNAYHSLSYTSKKNKDSSLQSTAERFKHQGEWLAKGGVSAENIASAEVYGRTDKGNDIVFIKRVENSRVTATPSANAYPYQYKSSKDKSGSLFSCFGYGKKEPKEQHTAGGISPHCIPCEKNNCWIEIDVRDEHNQSFQGLKATLTDATGTAKTVTLQNGPTLVEGFAVGPVTVKLENKSWLKAAQSREALKEGETSQVPAYTDKLFGHDDVKREHVKVTTGDLCLTDPEQPLPEGHKAGQAQSPRFITKHSYVIEVKSYQINILRIGVFFDGTSNNTFNHLIGKDGIEAFLEQCAAPSEREILRKQCEAGDVPLKVASQANDITNIGKAHELYRTPKDNELLAKIYVDGIGTENGEEDAGSGQASDLGGTSSLSKVEKACDTMIVEAINEQLGETLAKKECIHRIEFDVFGFSRGASAARQFINVLDKQKGHLLAKSMEQESGIRLKAGFDWADHNDCRIMFAGLFDTVTTSVRKRSVTLDPECAERVVHLIAADEWRFFFALTRITDDKFGAKIAPNFTEVIVPGAHSDVGGGYYSRWSLSNPNSDPALTEQVIIKACRSEEPATMTEPRESSAYRRARKYADEQVKKGWGNEVVELPTWASSPVRNKLSLRLRTRRHPKTDRMNVEVEVLINRVVEGEYSRIPLHMMVEAARDVGVPFQVWDEARADLSLEPLSIKIPHSNLVRLDREWLHVAKERGVVRNLTSKLTPDDYRQLRFEYLHHSADTGLVNMANSIDGEDGRKVYNNQEGG